MEGALRLRLAGCLSCCGGSRCSSTVQRCARGGRRRRRVPKVAVLSSPSPREVSPRVQLESTKLLQESLRTTKRKLGGPRPFVGRSSGCREPKPEAVAQGEMERPGVRLDDEGVPRHEAAQLQLSLSCELSQCFLVKGGAWMQWPQLDQLKLVYSRTPTPTGRLQGSSACRAPASADASSAGSFAKSGAGRGQGGACVDLSRSRLGRTRTFDAEMPNSKFSRRLQPLRTRACCRQTPPKPTMRAGPELHFRSFRSTPPGGQLLQHGAQIHHRQVAYRRPKPQSFWSFLVVPDSQ